MQDQRVGVFLAPREPVADKRVVCVWQFMPAVVRRQHVAQKALLPYTPSHRHKQQWVFRWQVRGGPFTMQATVVWWSKYRRSTTQSAMSLWFGAAVLDGVEEPCCAPLL
eukprot:scaffold2441_cov413-Prasinococcus_capsulatus_cf.AAC.3